MNFKHLFSLNSLCSLCTLSGNKVCGPFELQHGACYIAVPFGQKFRKLQYVDIYDNLIAEARKYN